MIVRPDGHNVFPNEIEVIINKNKNVKNCVVIGVRDLTTSTGEYPYAFIELNENCDEESTLEEIKLSVNKSLSLRDRPREADYILTSMKYKTEGKVDRDALLKLVK